jgi:hypothetical protein
MYLTLYDNNLVIPLTGFRDCVVIPKCSIKSDGARFNLPFCKEETRAISKIYMVSENQNPPCPPFEKGGNTINIAFATQSL